MLMVEMTRDSPQLAALLDRLGHRLLQVAAAAISQMPDGSVMDFNGLALPAECDPAPLPAQWDESRPVR
jgi:hypothetical protein